MLFSSSGSQHLDASHAAAGTYGRPNDFRRMFPLRKPASRSRFTILASQAEEPQWRNLKPDRTAMTARQFKLTDLRYDQVTQHPAVSYSSGTAQPTNPLKHHHKLRVARWADFALAAEAFWEGSPPPTPAFGKVTVDNEESSSRAFLGRVTDPVSDVMEPDGQHMWRRIGGGQPNRDGYKESGGSLEHSPSVFRISVPDFE